MIDKLTKNSQVWYLNINIDVWFVGWLRCQWATSYMASWNGEVVKVLRDNGVIELVGGGDLV